MDLTDYRYPFFVICLLCSIRGEGLPSYNVEGKCGNTISETQTAGVIKFERLTYFTDCLITVTPQKLDTGPGKVMLYFTEFILPSPCSSINVTVFDGDDPRYAPPVKGLPNTLCKRNTSLIQTNMVFNTTGSKFALLIRRKVYDVPATGSFVLKFSSYTEGPCSDVDSITTCKSGRCTPSQFHCHDDIDTCGWNEEEVCSEEDKTIWENIGSSLWSTFKDVLIGTGVLLACVGVSWFVMTVYKKYGNHRRPFMRLSLRSPTPLIQTIETNQQTDIAASDAVGITLDSSSESSVSSPRRSSHQEADISDFPPSYDELEPDRAENQPHYDGTSTPSSDTTEPRSLIFDDDVELPASYGTFRPTPSAPPADTEHNLPIDIPDAPPPTYDDYMSNENIYKNDGDS